MRQDSSFALWGRAWLLVPLSVVLAASVSWKAWQRWQILHGTRAAAHVYQKLGKDGSGSSGKYHLIVKYDHPQGREFYARVETDRSTHHDLALDAPVEVCYHLDHQQALLADEWSLSAKLLCLLLISLFLLHDGWGANHRWRHRRRDGYLPD
ncbi:hypothetical protein [Hymenobacter persicinus]|uniref:DUF3592 domain-containing protein n=1 Tax=Hymenobacter persicinus TaxID=2025506 RepID=A0A4V1ZAW5_9BACT|nr:hypothetical protein [Hymenobacter persicinus]RYU80728.1 hypothetical protein EWM57_07695 [Hymenobacter persicinus]